MKYLYISLAAGILLLSANSCKQTAQPESRNPELQSLSENFINISVDRLEEKEFLLSEISENSEWIVLDSPEEALINYPSAFAISEQHLLITDIDQFPAKLFARDGRFLREIGTIGKGPEEYLSVVSPYLSDNGKEVWLLLGGNYANRNDGSFYIYSTEGEYLRSEDFLGRYAREGNSNDALVHEGEILIPGNVDSPYMLLLKQLGQEEVTEIPGRIPEDYFHYMTNISALYPVGEQTYHLKIGESDTLYRFSSADFGLQPIAAIENKRHKYDAEAIRAARQSEGEGRFARIQKATEGGYSIALLGESGQYYIFEISMPSPAGTERHLVLADKQDGKAYQAKLKDDRIEGMPLSGIPRIYKNRYLIYYLPVLDLQKQYAKLKADKLEPVAADFWNTVQEMKADDNGVLYLVAIK